MCGLRQLISSFISSKIVLQIGKCIIRSRDLVRTSYARFIHGRRVIEHPVKGDQLDQTQPILQKMRSTCVAACYDGLGAEKMESCDHH